MPSTRVLIVDDQPVFRRVARDFLEARGFVLKARLVDADLGTFWRQAGGP